MIEAPAPPPPPSLHDLPAGTELVAGLRTSVVSASGDFETYSECGLVWDALERKWRCLEGASQGKKGLPVVGAAKYAEHPSTEVLTFTYDLRDGKGPRRWRPGLPLPTDLFEYVQRGGTFQAWNAGFEAWIWRKVCTPKYGWPELPLSVLRCAMAKSRAYGLPGALDNAGSVLDIATKKDKDGARLLKKFSIPRDPTAKDPRTRITRLDDPEDAERLDSYCDTDVLAEAEIAAEVPDLTPLELEYWQVDQAINRRGVHMDRESIESCIEIVRQALTAYDRQLCELTEGAVTRASQLPSFKKWMEEKGVPVTSLDEEAIDGLLLRDNLPPIVRQALEIRAAVGSSSVKKVFAMANQLTMASRLHDLFSFHAARTGRPTGNGPQPTNLPNSGPEVYRCECERHYPTSMGSCPWCGSLAGREKKLEWNSGAVEDALYVINSRSLELVEYYFGHAMGAISACLRGLFTAAPGHVIMCSDYSAIEAVVLAELAGEQWRKDLFRAKGKIYEMSGAKIAGISYDEVIEHKRLTGDHHPCRKMGKVGELASGYGGWIGAWLAFNAGDFMTEEEIKRAILAWRDASPAIVEFWGGQSRRHYRQRTPELYGVEGAAIRAVQQPGAEQDCRGIKFIVKSDVLYITLLSGRSMVYHQPRLTPSAKRPGELQLSYMTWNTNTKYGAKGWVRMETYGGRLVENITQATANDILRFASINLERAGYGIVLHVYDEIAAEVPEGFGSIEEFERIMGTMPAWAEGWPIRAAGGFVASRYRK